MTKIVSYSNYWKPIQFMVAFGLICTVRNHQNGKAGKVLLQLNSALKEESKEYTYKGLNISAIKKSGILRIKITGSVTETLDTSGQYITIATIPSNFVPRSRSTKFVIFYTGRECQLVINGTTVMLGYSRNKDTTEDISKGTGVRIDESFVI